MADESLVFALLAYLQDAGQSALVPLMVDGDADTIPALADDAPAKVQFVILPNTTSADGCAIITELPTRKSSETVPAPSDASDRDETDTWVLAAPRNARSRTTVAHTPVTWVLLDDALKADAPLAPMRFVPPSLMTARGLTVQHLLCTSHANNGTHANKVLHMQACWNSVVYPVSVMAHETAIKVRASNTSQAAAQ
jgi:hypothetical protein